MRLIFALYCLFAFSLLALSPGLVRAEQLLVIKYRATPVDVDKPHFESLDTSGSSVVRGAWYDKSKQYMIINLAGTNYHYCGLDEDTWSSFKSSASFGTAYNRTIKKNFDCRIFPVPSY